MEPPSRLSSPSSLPKKRGSPEGCPAIPRGERGPPQPHRPCPAGGIVSRRHRLREQAPVEPCGAHPTLHAVPCGPVVRTALARRVDQTPRSPAIPWVPVTPKQSPRPCWCAHSPTAAAITEGRERRGCRRRKRTSRGVICPPSPETGSGNQSGFHRLHLLVLGREGPIQLRGQSQKGNRNLICVSSLSSSP